MSRDQQSVRDMRSAAQDILSFTAGMDQAALAADRRTQAAVLYEIVVVGEAANRVSQNFQVQHPNIPWKDIIGMRNMLAHQDDDVDINEVWDVVSQDIPELIALLDPLLKSFGD